MEYGEKFFLLPDNAEIRSRLVASLPKDWATMDGNLTAPSILVDTDQVARDTGYLISRAHSRVEICGRVRKEGGSRKEVDPDIHAVLFEKKWPHFVSFKEIGVYSRRLQMGVALEIATRYVAKGYGGWLYLRSKCLREETDNNPARCSIRFQPHVARVGQIIPRQQRTIPAFIRLSWKKSDSPETEERYFEELLPIEFVCREVGLEEAPELNELSVW